MNDLSQTLSTVRRRITRYKSKSITEQDTKASLIDPVLRALGWELEDLDEVKREYKGGKWKLSVDYALFLLREPRLLVEAKALGKNLSDPRWGGQVLSYAMLAGVKWAVLTDGNEYRIYNAYAEVPFAKKLFRAVRLSDPDSPTEDTLRLLSRDRIGDAEIDRYWNAYFVDSQVGAALRALFTNEPTRPMVNLIKKQTGLTYKEVKASLKRAAVEIEFPLEVAPAAQRPAIEKKPERKQKPKKTHYGVSLADLIDAGLITPPLELERDYKGQRLTARVEANGTVTCMGESFTSLSYAGGHARKTIIGSPSGLKYPQTAGWSFWRYRNEAGELEKMHELRVQYLAQTDS